MRILSAFLLATTLAYAQGLTVPEYDRDHGVVDVFDANDNIAWENATWDYLNRRVFNFNGQATDDFVPIAVLRDEIGQTHVRFQHYLNGFVVYGSHYTVHTRSRDRQVLSISGGINDGAELEATPMVDGFLAPGLAEAHFPNSFVAQQRRGELAYVLDQKGTPLLAWTLLVSYENKQGPQLDRVFLSAQTGDLVARHPQFHYARNRRTHDGNNSTVLPGTLIRTEASGASGDGCLDAAHDFAGNTYDYYSTIHGRDSYDNAGAALIATVHHRINYNNAFWNGTQMVYGDGDGVTFICLAQALDVVAHELTHAVTENSAGLIYQNESGALNEAMSDIFGASAEAWVDGAVSADTWLLGEDIFTPATPGDALRTMDDPAAAGDRDYYPDRFTGTADNGGVHTNSGIANLAYVLLVQGGTHPRGKTTNVVGGIGINSAQAIFYRALTVYMTPGTNFTDARQATLDAASDLFGAASAEVTQVSNAWEAVGVIPPAPPTPLQNGVAVTGLAGATGVQKFFTLNVPAGSSALSFTLAGANGDADLYVRFGSAPTTATFDFNSISATSNESVSIPTPSTGTYHVLVHAFATYTGLTLTGSFSGGAGTNLPPTASFNASTNDLTASFTDTSTDSDGNIASRSWNFGDGAASSLQNPSHTYAAAGTFTVSLTVTDNNGASDTTSQTVTVTNPPQTTIALTLKKAELKNGQLKVELDWSGQSGATVEIYRNGTLIDTVTGDNRYKDQSNVTGTGPFVYQVCEVGGVGCSNTVTATF